MSLETPTPAGAPAGRDVRATFTFHDRTSEATARVLDHAKRDRVRRALLGLAACWGAAVAAVFLPVLHFVLVPALLIAGPLLAFARLGERRTITGITGPCPACGGAITLRPGGSAAAVVRCDHCRRPVEWSLAPDA
jgi:hypothetical protein